MDDELEQTIDVMLDNQSGLLDKLNSAEERMENGFGVLVRRVEAMNTQTQYSRGGISITSTSTAAHELLRKHLGEEEAAYQTQMAEIVCENATAFPEPETALLAAEWFRTQIKLCLPRRFGGEQSKLYQQKLEYEQALGGLPIERKTLRESVDSSGGYLVPIAVAGEIQRMALDSSVVAGRCRRLPMTTKEVRVPSESTGVTVFFSNEGEQLSKGEPLFGERVLIAQRIHGRAAASIEVVEDSALALLPYLQNVFAEKIGATLDAEILEGTDNFSGLNTEASISTIATTASDGEQVEFLDLVRTAYAATESSAIEGSVWYLHPRIMASVVGLLDSQGRPVFQPAPAAGVPSTILGFSAFTTSSIATNVTRGSTSDTSNIYFGPPRRMLLGVRQDLRLDITDQGPGWERYEIDLRLVGRYAYTTGVPAAFARIVGATQLQ